AHSYPVAPAVAGDHEGRVRARRCERPCLGERRCTDGGDDEKECERSAHRRDPGTPADDTGNPSRLANKPEAGRSFTETWSEAPDFYAVWAGPAERPARPTTTAPMQRAWLLLPNRRVTRVPRTCSAAWRAGKRSTSVLPAWPRCAVTPVAKHTRGSTPS